MLRRFDGSVAVVTGAASGIGRAIATALVARGARVTLADVSPNVHEVAASLGGRARGALCDVSDAAAVQALADEVAARESHVHLLVNNAGVSVHGRFDEVAPEDFEWLFGVNFRGVVNGCRSFLPHLRREREAHVVNVCSSFAWLGVPGKSAYAASKAAVRALSESLRLELRGTGVGVTLLFPGPVDTGIVRAGRATSSDQRDAEAAFVKARGLSAERVAARCLEGVRRDRARVVVGVDYALFDLGVRASPTLALAAVGALKDRLPF